MTQNLPTVQRAQALAPFDYDSALRYAQTIATAKSIPQIFRNSPGDCLLVIEQARFWGMNPAALLRECAMISDKLMISGKAIAAAVNANAGIVGRLEYRFEGQGDDRMVIVSGRYPNESEPRTVEVTLRHARTNAAAWRAQPDQQLVYTGARVWARRHAPDIVMGVRAIDEAGSDEPVLPRMAAPPTSPRTQSDVIDAELQDQIAEENGPPSDPSLDPETGEIGARTLELVGDDYRSWGQKFIGCVRAETSDVEVQRWLDENKAVLTSMLEHRAQMHRTLMHSVNSHRAGLKDFGGDRAPDTTPLGAG